MVQYKIMRGIIKYRYQFFAVVDDGDPLPPSQQSRKQAHDLSVFPLGEQVGYLNRIIFNESGAIVKQVMLVEL